MMTKFRKVIAVLVSIELGFYSIPPSAIADYPDPLFNQTYTPTVEVSKSNSAPVNQPQPTNNTSTDWLLKGDHPLSPASTASPVTKPTLAPVALAAKAAAPAKAIPGLVQQWSNLSFEKGVIDTKLNFGKAFTWSFTLQPSVYEMVGSGNLAMFSDKGYHNRIDIGLRGGQLWISYSDRKVIEEWKIPGFRMDETKNVTFVREGDNRKGGYKVYFDGVLVDKRDTQKFETIKPKNTPTKDPSPTNLYLGGHFGYPDFAFKGRLPDVRVYNRALSSSEVMQISQESLSKAPPPDPSPLTFFVKEQAVTTAAVQILSDTKARVVFGNSDYEGSVSRQDDRLIVKASVPPGVLYTTAGADLTYIFKKGTKGNYYLQLEEIESNGSASNGTPFHYVHTTFNHDESRLEVTHRRVSKDHMGNQDITTFSKFIETPLGRKVVFSRRENDGQYYQFYTYHPDGKPRVSIAMPRGSSDQENYHGGTIEIWEDGMVTHAEQLPANQEILDAISALAQNTSPDSPSIVAQRLIEKWASPGKVYSFSTNPPKGVPSARVTFDFRVGLKYVTLKEGNYIVYVTGDIPKEVRYNYTKIYLVKNPKLNPLAPSNQIYLNIWNGRTTISVNGLRYTITYGNYYDAVNRVYSYGLQFRYFSANYKVQTFVVDFPRVTSVKLADGLSHTISVKKGNLIVK